MTRWGYSCSSEEFEASDLVRQAVTAEQLGFDFVTVSDHFHPWISEQGHSPFVWTTVGAIAAATERIGIATGVTCPIMRIAPTIVAQAAATSAELSGERFVLGVGTGEALNEHIHGQPWPESKVRRQMLTEAVEVIRELWGGSVVNHRGTHFTVQQAKLFSAPPSGDVPVVWAASGKESARAAAAVGAGLWATSPDGEVVSADRDAGGGGPIYGQVGLCWGDPEEAVETVLRAWPTAGLSGQLNQDLPAWFHFEAACATVRAEDIVDSVVCGWDAGAVVKAVEPYLEVGFDHLHFHQIGPDQGAFFAAWEHELRSLLS